MIKDILEYLKLFIDKPIVSSDIVADRLIVVDINKIAYVYYINEEILYFGKGGSRYEDITALFEQFVRKQKILELNI